MKAYLVGLLIIVLWSSGIYASAFDNMVNILKISESRKTIVINRGYLDKLSEGEHGVMLREFTKDGIKKLRPVARIKAIKTFPESSVWIVFKVYETGDFYKKAKLILFSENELLAGKTKLVIRRKNLVSQREDIEQSVEDSLTDDGSELVEKDYTDGKELHDLAKHYSDVDVDLIDLGEFESGPKKDANHDEALYPSSIYKSQHGRDFAKYKHIQAFDKMVAAQVLKYNDPNFTLREMYFDIIRKHDGETQDKKLNQNVMDKMRHDLNRKRSREEKFYRDLLTSGESWSDDYSDEELSELITNMGIVHEIERRKTMTAIDKTYQLYFSMNSNFVDNENSADTENTMKSKTDSLLAFEYYLFKRIPKFDKFAFEGEIRYANDGLSVGDVNATLSDLSAAFIFNWYPFYKAHALERNIFYFGTSMRTGTSNLAIGTLGETGTYTSTSFPGFRAGLKYNFSGGFGLRMMASYETIDLDRRNTSDDGGTLPNRTSYNEGKLGIGLSYFF